MRIRAAGSIVVGVLALLAVPSTATEALPPNRADPCAHAGRDTCKTTGVGFYKVYRYGMRWFGDFRGAIPGEPHAFCLDLRFWYPSPSYRYRQEAGPLRNRQGRAVGLESRRRLAYAIWRYGRSDNPSRQAAVMLYVHSLVGDARAGEADPAALGARVAALYRQVARDSAALHGPYRVDVRVPGRLVVGRPATATVRVLSAAGRPMTGLTLAVSSQGTTGADTVVRIGPGGAATIGFTPATTAVRLTARADRLASTLPVVFAPSSGAAAPNGQRLAVPRSQTVSGTVAATAARRQIAVTTAATPSVLVPGGTSTDRVVISGAAPGWTGTVSVRIYGPFPAQAQIRCDGTPLWTGTFAARGNGTYGTSPVGLARAGWYAYVLVVPGDTADLGVTTACAVPAETFKVQAAPALTTTVSTQRATVGDSIYDTVHVTGLAGVAVVVQAALYGPFPSADRISCDGTPAWQGTVGAAADGDYQTTPVTLAKPGIYSYRERIDAGDLVRAVQAPCADTAETTVAVVHPRITTAISSRAVQTGATVADRVTVTGLGDTAVSLRVELWGPFAAGGSIECTGATFKTQTLSIPGDGTYTTATVQLSKAGTYTYRASIAAGSLNDAAVGDCGADQETVVVTDPVPPPKPPTPPKPPKVPPKTPTPPPTTTTTTTPPPKPPTRTSKPGSRAPVVRPKAPFVPARVGLTTLASHEVVRPGTTIFDRIAVRGIRSAVEVELFGPFATRAAIRCSRRPLWTGQVTVRRDGVVRSPAVRVRKAGLYAFRERVRNADGSTRLLTACAIDDETSLGAPLVITGRGDRPHYVPARGAGPLTPARVRVAALGIDAPVVPVGIDVAQGVLGVPPSIHTVGWWRDGAIPGSASGTVMIAGHVDSAAAGPGAFFRLRHATRGDRVEVTTTGGRHLAYRVVSIRNYPKRALPTAVWTRQGAARLVLVTCGGPFDRKAGHYRDNVVVTAVPIR